MRRLLVAVALSAMALAACSSSQPNHASSARQRENSQAAAGLNSLFTNQPLPVFTYSQVRQNLIELETAQATGVATTSFFFNQGDPNPIGSCPSIGTPIANTAQLSNPQQVVNGGRRDGGYTAATISQADPYGVYTPPTSSGTFVICVDAQGHPYADYWEGFVRTVFAPARWNAQSHQVELIGPPSFSFSQRGR